MRHQTLIGGFAVAGLFMLYGCGPTGFENARVNIQYEERAVCSCFTEDQQSNQCAGDGFFVIYKLESINNADTQAQSFSFDPSNLLTNLADKDDTVGQPLSNYNSLSSVTAPPHAILPLYLRYALHTSSTDANVLHDLFYKGFVSRNITMSRFPPPSGKSIVRKDVCTPADLPPDGAGN